MRRPSVAAASASAAVVLAVASLAPDAQAQTAAGNHEAEVSKPYERRGGFVLGTVLGAALGTASGNPKGQNYRFDPAYEAKLGFAWGYRCTPFLGGALTDWLTVGIGASFGSMWTGEHHDATVTSFVFHFEAFPLYAKGGPWRDLGAMVDFGAGVGTIHNTRTGEELANSAVASTAGLGVFWEPWRIWHVAAGPAVAYQRNWSQWYERDDVLVGLRGVFYGAP